MFLTDFNSVSRRTIIIDESDTAGWAYLTKPDSQTIYMDCWLYNKIDTPDSIEISGENLPPPVPKKLLRENYKEIPDLDESRISIEWDTSGEKVYIYIDKIAAAFMDAETRQMYNVNFVSDCPWGKPLPKECCITPAARLGKE